MSNAKSEAIAKLQIERGTGRRKRRRTKWIIMLVVVLVLLALAAGPITDVLFRQRVTTATVTRESSTQDAVRTTANGYVVARTRAAISSRLSGRLEELLVDVGDRVEKGQLVGRLGQDDLRAAVAEALAILDQQRRSIDVIEARKAVAERMLEAARNRRERAEAAVATTEERFAEAQRRLGVEQRLRESEVSTDDDVERARSERDVAERQLKVARVVATTAAAEEGTDEANLAVMDAELAAAHAGVRAAQASAERAEALRRDADIVAPFAGVVIRKEAEVGEMVAPVNAAGSTTRGAIVSLAAFDSLEMEVDVIERDIGRVEAGLPCRIVLDARAEPYAGHVRQIVPTADRTRGTVLVKVTFDALDDDVRPEMSGRVEFVDASAAEQLLEEDKVWVPSSAVVQRDGANGVWLVEGDVVRFAPIGVGDTQDDRTVVGSGLNGGEEIVVDPSPALEPGMTVHAAPAAEGD